MTFTDDILSALVTVAQDAVLCEHAAGVPSIRPLSGDLVVAVEGCPRADGKLDPDAIGWLAAHGKAPLNYDGTGPLREVWDVMPLSGRHARMVRHGLFVDGKPCQRWENVTFARVPSRIHALVEAMLRAP